MQNKFNIEVGSILQNARIAKNLTQEEVAEKVDCSSRYIGQLETIPTLGSIDLIIELCNLYEISLNDIYGIYLKAINLSASKDKCPNIVGYNELSSEYRSIIDNNISFLNTLQNKKKN